MLLGFNMMHLETSKSVSGASRCQDQRADVIQVLRNKWPQIANTEFDGDLIGDSVFQHINDSMKADRGHAVVQLVEALHYKLEGHGFDSRRCQWNFSLT